MGGCLYCSTKDTKRLNHENAKGRRTRNEGDEERDMPGGPTTNGGHEYPNGGRGGRQTGCQAVLRGLGRGGRLATGPTCSSPGCGGDW